MADDGSVELVAETLIPGDRVRYGSILLLCDNVAVSSQTVTIEGTKLAHSASGDVIDTGVRTSLCLSPGERVRTLSRRVIAYDIGRPLL